MIIYKIEHISSGKVYVGKSKKSPTEFESYYGSGKIIKSAINKYGKENFIKTILEICKTDEELNQQEKFWIGKFDCMTPKGYNIHEGGIGGDSFYHLSVEEKKIIFDKRLANNPDMYKKIKETRLQNGTNTLKPEHLLNVTAANRKKAANPIWRKKQSDYQLNKNSMEMIFTIEILSTKEIIQLKNIREVKEFVTNYNIKNQLSRKKRSNYWKLLFSNETTNMRLLDKKRAHYE